MATFINREEEIRYLTNHFETEPNNLLFVYGPKSSGKSSLLNKVIEALDKNDYVVNFIDLRGVIIYDFKTFLNLFFPKTLKGKAKDLLTGVKVNTGIFSIDIGEDSLFKENAFKIMEKRLIEYKENDIRPIIIIDEIQLLKSIYVNGQRYLLDELFNLFVRLTKVLHTAHVVLATSDSYFIEEIYNNAKLKKTTQLYFVDHLRKIDVEKWLLQENFTQQEIEMVWDAVGGSAWEITELINRKNTQNKTVKELCEYFVKDEFGKLREFVSVKIKDESRKIFYEVIEKIVNKGYCLKGEIENEDLLVQLIITMVNYDFWFYRVDEQKITANSKSIEMAMKLMC